MAGWMRLEKLDRRELLRHEIDELLAEPVQEPKVHKKGCIEVKMIPDTKTGKLYGPYRYYRWWEGGKLRCKYLGKADAQQVQQEDEAQEVCDARRQ